jgi:DnaJ-like protein
MAMTERKPADMSFRSWVEQQISEAEERGAFNGLRGAGKPLPRPVGPDDGQAWLRDYVRREGVPVEELLPEPLRLRKEAEALAGAAPAFRSAEAVRAAVKNLNERIMKWRLIPVGPPLFVPLVDEEAMVARWRDAQPPPAAPEEEPPAGAADPARRRWWRRRRAGG